MKILGRILIILIAALAVAGTATALVGNSSRRFSDTNETRQFTQNQPGGVSTS